MKSVSHNDEKADIQQVFDDLLTTKIKAVTYKDMVHYFYSYEMVFLYQEKNTDSHVIIELFSNRIDHGIVSSELQSDDAKVLFFTSDKHDATQSFTLILL